ncbi:hypothetical protein MBM_06619 [Drepanopeziza brunnea f. sp. 'multigermtubi' MB_m1]|uniref:Uncharacterized protein n=1 Tax=Marssonina brunnea f. sp. multigermtubi (strain MB_m1) TaxID=1072389 RepID=K1X3W0_MARBU|nr:uncharacterized protein MBM_06619 [Drepanopeziza brunnea f. sp. 'multigermtubi' MB_m1]EKD15403.1 hypothetical protein MBM_06619 [Drepanopeziza brunnea f. sp. 'multigermtubi' MB_m1]
MRTHTKGSSSGRQAPLKDSKVHGPTQKTLKTAQLKPLASLPQHLWMGDFTVDKRAVRAVARRRLFLTLFLLESVSGPLSSSVEKSAFVDGLQAKIEAQLAAFQKQLRENMHAELQAFRNARSTPAYTKLISLPVDIVEIKSESENEDDQCPVQSRALSNADLKSEDDGPDASGLGHPDQPEWLKQTVEDLSLILSQALNPNFHQDQHSKKAQLSPFRNKNRTPSASPPKSTWLETVLHLYFGTFRDSRDADRLCGSEMTLVNRHSKEYWAEQLDQNYGAKSRIALSTLIFKWPENAVGWIHKKTKKLVPAREEELGKPMIQEITTNTKEEAQEITVEEVMDAWDRVLLPARGTELDIVYCNLSNENLSIGSISALQTLERARGS